MNAVDQIIVQAFRENPILGALLGVLMDGGRIVSTSQKMSELLSMVPDIFFFEFKDLENDRENSLAALADYGTKDLIFIDEKASVDILWQIAKKTGAQIAIFSHLGSDVSLCDYVLEEKDLRSALMSIRPLFEKLKPFKGQIHMDGSRLNKALFLDRDGVIIEDTNYVKSADEVQLTKGIGPVLQKAKTLGYRLIVVTNQSGIGRGLFNFGAYEKVTDRMLELLAAEGILIDRILKAPFFENSQYASGLVRKSLRKPRPGMFHAVASEFRIDFEKSILVGDSASDLIAGAAAGIQNLYLVKSEKFDEQLKLWKQWPLRSRFEAKKNFVKNGGIDEIPQFLDLFLN